MKEKFKWYVIDKKYVQYLKQFDNKVENIEYNENLKPYIGIILSINNYDYYVPVSSTKEKHYKMKEDIDFIKILHNDTILGVLNINNMIPISKDNITILKYNEIAKRCCNFKLLDEKSLLYKKEQI